MAKGMPYLETEEGREELNRLKAAWTPSKRLNAQEFDGYLERVLSDSNLGFRHMILQAAKTRNTLHFGGLLDSMAHPIYDVEFLLGLRPDNLVQEQEQVKHRIVWGTFLLYLFEEWVVKRGE